MKYTFPLLLLWVSVAAGEALLPKGIRNDQNPNDRTLSPQDALERITVPEGFDVTLFAGEPDLSQPIAFTFDDRGRLWVVQNFSHPFYKENGSDRILIFEDTDGDGQFDEKKVFWDEGQYVTGIQYGHGGVWICNTPELQFIPDRDGDDVPDSEPITILDGWDMKGRNNVFNNLNWGPDGWLYGCIGQNNRSYVGAPGTPKAERPWMSRGLWRYHPVTKRFEVVARGAVNPWGLDWDDHGEAFFVNCVLPHAWHLIPGAYYVRRSSETDVPDIYGRIPPIADHLHWAGGHWTHSRNAVGKHSDTGGGHAHTGCMIYMGGNWPDAYRGTLFVGNIHGNRINNDALSRKGSSYVASHKQDFLFGNHPWFRSLSQKYGPDGGVFMSDWHDFGECHDHDGTHRTSGRIYKVIYGTTAHQRFDLTQNSNISLAQMQLHRNEWFVRHARRLLHERAVSGKDMQDANQVLRDILHQNQSVPRKLRALWCLNLTGGIHEKELIQLLNHRKEHVRAWVLRLLNDDAALNADALAALGAMAAKDSSKLVRLHLASQLQRISVSDRTEILLSLVGRAEDKDDRMIPKMLYYASMDVLSGNKQNVAALISHSRIPLFTEYLTRLTATRDYDFFSSTIMPAIERVPDDSALALVTGAYEGLKRKSDPAMPSSWPKVYQGLLARNSAELRLAATLLALRFGDDAAPRMLKALVTDTRLDSDVRRKSLDALVISKDPELLGILTRMLADDALSVPAINTLSGLDDQSVPERLFARFEEFNAQQRSAAMTTLCSRETYTLALAEKLESHEISVSYLSSFHIRQIQRFNNASLSRRIEKAWGQITSPGGDKDKEIARYKKLLNSKFMENGNLKNGKVVYTRSCGACHILFGEGGTLGPDLTGSGRKDLHYILENVVDPSAVVSKAFQLATLKTRDNRIITGLIAEEGEDSVTMTTLEDKIIVQRRDIASLERSERSMMPEGLLHILSPGDLRDLMLYLQK